MHSQKLNAAAHTSSNRRSAALSAACLRHPQFDVLRGCTRSLHGVVHGNVGTRMTRKAPMLPRRKPEPKPSVEAFLFRTRERLGFTVAYVERALGVSRDSLDRWEGGAGAYPIPPLPLARLLRFYSDEGGCSWKEARDVFQNAYPELDTIVSQMERGRVSASKGYDALPHRWIHTNHSNHLITWDAATLDEYDRVSALVTKHFANSVGDVLSVERPTHVAGSDVFRVQGKEKNIFLKGYRVRLEHKKLDSMVRIQRIVADPDSTDPPFPGARFLAPLNTNNSDRGWLESEWAECPVVIAYDFVEESHGGGITHYAGTSLEEIASIGASLARLNTLLIDNCEHPIADIGFTNENANWESCQALFQREADIPTRIRYLADAELKYIRETADRVNALKGTGSVFTLNDFHPHNVFVKRDRCHLIFDFDVRKEWPEQATVAFAMHRACREYVRRNIMTPSILLDPSEIPKIQHGLAVDSVNAFLSGYTSVRDSARAAVLESGVEWAKAINFRKLCDILWSSFPGNDDLRKRPEDVLFSEFVKFLSYLKELDVFADAVKELAYGKARLTA